MPEMANAGEHHGHAELVGGGNHVLVLDRPAGLDDGGCSGRGNRFKAIGEGKESVRGSDCALERQHGFLRSKARGIDAAHLARTHADGLAVAGIDDCVRLDVLADAPGEEQAAQFLGGRRTPGDDLQLVLGDAAGVGILQQQSAGDVLDDGPGGAECTSTRRRFFLAAKRSRASA